MAVPDIHNVSVKGETSTPPMVGLCFQGGGIKSYSNFFAIMWSIQQKNGHIDTLFRDVHIGTNSGGGWFQAALMTSSRFENILQNVHDLETYIESFRELFLKQGNKLDRKFHILNDLFRDCGVPEDSELYGLAVGLNFYEKNESWRALIDALFDDETTSQNKFMFASWTSVCVLLKCANTGEIENYKISIDGDNKQLAYLVMLMYTGDIQNPECDIPGIQGNIKIDRYKSLLELHSTQTMDISEVEQDICLVVNQSIVAFTGPSSSALGFFASAPYVKEKMPSYGVEAETATKLAPPLLRCYAWSTQHPRHDNCLSLSDGGTEDNTALSATIYRLQKDGIYSGTVVSFQNEWETYKVFQDPGRKVKKGEMYQTIFHGTAPEQASPIAGCAKMTLTICDATTVDNPWIGIVGGKTYRVVTLCANCVPPLLPGDKTLPKINEEYIDAIRTITTDMKVLLDSSLLKKFGLVEPVLTKEVAQDRVLFQDGQNKDTSGCCNLL